MTQTSWAHLPNAHHIDWVLASLKANPQAWVAARSVARGVALNAALNAALFAARFTAWDSALDAARYAARDAALDVIAALIAWDDCAYLFDLPPHAVQWIADKGDNAALLLLPACAIRHSLNLPITGE